MSRASGSQERSSGDRTPPGAEFAYEVAQALERALQRVERYVGSTLSAATACSTYSAGDVNRAFLPSRSASPTPRAELQPPQT